MRKISPHNSVTGIFSFAGEDNMRVLKIMADILVVLGIGAASWSGLKEVNGKDMPWPCETINGPVPGAIAVFCNAEDWLDWEDPFVLAIHEADPNELPCRLRPHCVEYVCYDLDALEPDDLTLDDQIFLR